MVDVEALVVKLAQCAVCSQKHAQPQILPCMHSFCSACLAGERATEGVTARSCPVCGLDAAYAVEGVVAADLIAVAVATSSALMCVECASSQAQVWCNTCQVALCQKCLAVTHASRLFRSHRLERVEERGDRPRSMPMCPAHPTEVVSFIARDGVTLLCRDCVLVGEAAGGAPADLVEGAIPLRDAAMAARSRVSSIVEFSEQRAAQVRDMQRTVADVVPQMQADHSRLAASICDKADALAASVDARHDALRQMVHEWKEREVALSEKLVSNLRTTQAALHNAARVSSMIAHRTDELGALQVMGELHPHLSALCTQTVPSIQDFPISPVPAPGGVDAHVQGNAADSIELGAGVDATVGVGTESGGKQIAATLKGEKAESEGAFLPAGLHGKHGGVLCALGGSDGLRDLAVVETLQVGAGGVGGMATRGGAAAAWGAGVSLPACRRAAACALFGDSLYVVGGWNGNEACKSAFVFRQVSARGEWGWQAIASLQHRRQALGCAVLHQKLYAVGGYDGVSNLQSVERYDAIEDSWLSVADMNCSRRGCAAVAVNGHLLAIGGSDAASIHCSVESYNMYSNVWSMIKPMASPRRLPAAAVVNGKVVVVGGWDGVRALASCEVFDPESGLWGGLAPMAEARQGPAAVAAASRLYVLGGWDGVSNARLASVEVLDASMAQWSNAPAMQSARFGLCAAVLPIS